MENDNNTNIPNKESVSDVLKKYKESNNIIPPKVNSFSQEEFKKNLTKETDPDLMTTYEHIKLPSKGLFYENNLSEIDIEYLTSKDEDILTTPSLIESGKALEILLKRKIKTPGVDPKNLLSGDRNAILLFLRTSSYGTNYTVQVPDPRTGVLFKSNVDLHKLKYKELTELPDSNGLFYVELPMRKKTVAIKLLTNGEEDHIFKTAEATKEAFNREFSEYSTMKLKAHIYSINERVDRDYINKFIDAMPALDAYTIRKKILDVSPDVDMTYEFTALDGYKFNANLSIGIDFFFPSI